MVVVAAVAAVVTANDSELEPSGIVTLAGTLAVAGLVELRLTNSPPCGAGAETLKFKL